MDLETQGYEAQWWSSSEKSWNSGSRMENASFPRPILRHGFDLKHCVHVRGGCAGLGYTRDDTSCPASFPLLPVLSLQGYILDTSKKSILSRDLCCLHLMVRPQCALRPSSLWPTSLELWLDHCKEPIPEKCHLLILISKAWCEWRVTKSQHWPMVWLVIPPKKIHVSGAHWTIFNTISF